MAGWLIKKYGSQVAKEGFRRRRKVRQTEKLSTMSRSAVVAGWPIRKWWLKERRVWGNKRNETEDTRLDDVMVSTHRWWLFTAMACLKLGDLLNKLVVKKFKNGTFIESNHSKEKIITKLKCDNWWKCETHILVGLLSFKIENRETEKNQNLIFYLFGRIIRIKLRIFCTSSLALEIILASVLIAY